MTESEWPQCEHSRLVVRRRVNAAGRDYFVHQCLDCGRGVGSQVAKRSIENLGGVEPFDEEAEAAYYREQQEFWQRAGDERAAAYAAKQMEWWRRYNRYLLTPEWRQKRAAVLERDEYLCPACRKARAQHVHHLTYDHAFREPLFDLVSVCQTCHDALHAAAHGETA